MDARDDVKLAELVSGLRLYRFWAFLNPNQVSAAAVAKVAAVAVAAVVEQ